MRGTKLLSDRWSEVTDLCPGEVPEGGRLVPRNAAPAQQAPVVVPVAPHLQDRLLSSEEK
jgi:hypothetical protein